MNGPTDTRKSQRTRARIAHAAQAAFARTGFSATSVRDIAREAGCDPALVIRYFGSKEALFTEVAQFDLNLPDLSGLSPAQAAQRLAGHFVEIWEDGEESERFQILLRSASAHEPSAARLRTVFREQVMAMISSFAPRNPRNAESAAMAASVILGTALSRYVLRLPPQAGIPASRLAGNVAACLEPVFRDAAEPAPEIREEKTR